MAVKSAVRELSQLRLQSNSKREEKHVEEVKQFVPLDATFTIADPRISRTLQCKRMSGDASKILDDNFLVRLCNISQQRLDISNLPTDHEWRNNVPRIALLEVELENKVHMTLSGRVAPIPEGDIMVFAGKDADGTLVVFDIREGSFDEWRDGMRGEPMCIIEGMSEDAAEEGKDV
jgi:hypothetical protein